MPGAGSPRNCRDAKLIAVLRDPVDRAYSNWMHLWVDGLEPEPDFSGVRPRAGTHRRRLGAVLALPAAGLYGSQLDDLYRRVAAERIMVVRYRELVADPVGLLNRVCRLPRPRAGRDPHHSARELTYLRRNGTDHGGAVAG